MGRTRNPAIAEDAAELRRQARRNAGKPQQRRLLFLAFLKENPTCSIAEGAEAAGLSARQGRYLWEDYRAGGLERVLARRSWKNRKPEASPDPVAFSPEGTVAGMTATDLLNFMNAVAGLREIDDAYKWARRLGDILVEFIPEVDYAVVNIRHNTAPKYGKKQFVFHRHVFPDGRSEYAVRSMNEYMLSDTDLLIQHGRQLGFQFDHYHFPPLSLGLYINSSAENNGKIYVGTILVFRKISETAFSPHLIKLMESIRPFLSFLYMEFITRSLESQLGSKSFTKAISSVAGHAGLTLREKDILLLLLLGNTYEEIAELLTIAPATVGKHVRSIYKKTGVRRLSEFFARYFTPRDHFPEKEKKGE